MSNTIRIKPVTLKRIFGLFCAVVIMGTSTGAGAGWYAALDAGTVFLEDSSSTASDAFGNSVSFDTEFDTGFGVHGAIGHSWGGFRLEGEVSYRENDLDTFDITNVIAAGIGSLSDVGNGDFSGDVSALAFMGNAWYDFNTGSPWRPFLGGGLGVARISINDVAMTSLTLLGVPIPLASPVPLADDDDWVFAYQVGAGIGFEVTPTTTISLGYRFFGTADPDFTDVNGDPFDAEYHSHNVEIGLRFSF